MMDKACFSTKEVSWTSKGGLGGGVKGPFPLLGALRWFEEIERIVVEEGRLGVSIGRVTVPKVCGEVSTKNFLFSLGSGSWSFLSLITIAARTAAFWTFLCFLFAPTSIFAKYSSAKVVKKKWTSEVRNTYVYEEILSWWWETAEGTGPEQYLWILSTMTKTLSSCV